MGGVPLLLVAVAMGITYGWQPDGNGGVDYTIQIPPEQVDQLRQSGTISSAIAPEIRGHVTRVIVKVGKAPLERITPPELVHQRKSPVIVAAHSSADDRAHVPVPEIDLADGRPPHSVRLKPDANDPGRGPGMGLPPSLGGAADAAAQAGNGFRDAMSELSADLAQRTRNDVNNGAAQAQGAAAARTSDAMREQLAAQNRNQDPRFNLAPGAGNAPSSALNELTNRANAGQATAGGQDGRNTRGQVPPFTGQGNDNVARIRTGGPTTAPANPRDKKWFEMNAKTGPRRVSTDPINNKSAWPEMVGPPDPRAGQRPMSTVPGLANDSSDRRGGSQPLGSTPTFARIPAAEGLRSPNSQRQADPNAQTMAITDYERAQYQLQLQQQQQQQRAAQNPAGNLGYPNRETPFGGSIATASDNRGNGLGLPNTQSRLQPASRESLAASAAPNQQPYDPRLSPTDVARLPYGAWSMDSYGNPIDREGRILDQYGRLVSQQRAIELTRGRASSPVSLDRPVEDSYSRSTIRTPQTGLASRVSLEQPFDRTAPRRTSPTIQEDNGRAAISSSDRLQANSRNDSPRDYSNPNSLTKNRQTLAAQPLFNGLLLMSIVANVYLIFWLKNLRHQFRDLVASKRATASEISA